MKSDVISVVWSELINIADAHGVASGENELLGAYDENDSHNSQRVWLHYSLNSWLVICYMELSW